jgi:hypothetical protein
MWEEWRYPPECPDLGDYIQVDTECQFYMHRVSLEGIDDEGQQTLRVFNS